MEPLRVLIIDNHAPFRRVARELLERRGFDVVAEVDGATAGMEAVAALVPDAVLVDVRLPDGDGFDVCRMLTEADPTLAVLLISADVHHGPRARDCSAVAYMHNARLASSDLGGLLGRGADEAHVGRTTG